MTNWLRRRRGANDERPLLVRAREDPELFGQFFAELHEQVLAFFARRVLDPEVAFDLAAETFAAAFSSLQAFRGSSDDEAHAWLWTIARNKLYRWRERGEVERRSLRALGIEVPPMTSVEHERAEELADLGRIRGRVADALRGLKPDQREAVRLRVIDEQPYEAIAQALGVTEVVVRARVSRGLRALALVLENEGVVEPRPARDARPAPGAPPPVAARQVQAARPGGGVSRRAGSARFRRRP